MKRIVLLTLATVLLCSVSARAGEADGVPKAKDAATAWLALTDSGKYAESWSAASGFFKGAVTKDQWVGALQRVRAPLGALKSRKLRSATFTTTVPGAPAGQYVIVQYDAQFANASAVNEVVTPMLDKDGKWRVAGYLIR